MLDRLVLLLLFELRIPSPSGRGVCQSVDVFHRTGENPEGDRWLLAPFQGLAAIAHLPSLDLHLPLTEIYATLEPGDLEPAPPMPMSDRHPDEFTDDRTHA